MPLPTTPLGWFLLIVIVVAVFILDMLLIYKFVFKKLISRAKISQNQTTVLKKLKENGLSAVFERAEKEGFPCHLTLTTVDRLNKVSIDEYTIKLAVKALLSLPSEVESIKIYASSKIENDYWFIKESTLVGYLAMSEKNHQMIKNLL
ncbi:hypothetical protein L0B53_12395 [Vibrio sp. SS-MA-C1-2]|uniref:hypothetical protein n=1 Tax=Vibrio sp. SS-MA-C1-2 TaxID=2908646 RepID=UPI001F3DC939|nr:hypothetical protein [Vibrio sp. SS-MA-C1-2]UJF17826.1 hypothetical protein L0B53_12395 [Vibrio sp. SS-MA-C1-2]